VIRATVHEQEEEQKNKVTGGCTLPECNIAGGDGAAVLSGYLLA